MDRRRLLAAPDLAACVPFEADYKVRGLGADRNPTSLILQRVVSYFRHRLMRMQTGLLKLDVRLVAVDSSFAMATHSARAQIEREELASGGGGEETARIRSLSFKVIWIVGFCGACFALASCALTPVPLLYYSCEATDKDRSRNLEPAVACNISAAEIPGTTIDETGRAVDALATCDELQKAEFNDSIELDVTILEFKEYYLKRRIHAALNKSFDYSVLVPEDGSRPETVLYIRVPAGYVTDFTSVPRGLAQSFYRTFAQHTFPSIAHDFLYAIGPPENGPPGAIGSERDSSWFDRKYADSALRSGMLKNRSRFFSRLGVYLATRLERRPS